MNFNIPLFGLGILNLTLVLVLIAKQSPLFPSQKWLIAFFGVFALDAFSEIIVFNAPLTAQYPYLEYLPTRLNLFYGACLYTYTQVAIGSQRSTYWYLRFFPTFIYFCTQSFFFFSQSQPQGWVAAIFFQNSVTQLICSFAYELFFISSALYILNRHKEQNSNATVIVDWIIILVKTVLFYMSLFFIKNLMEEIQFIPEFVRLGTLTLPIYFFCIFFLIYHTLRVPILLNLQIEKNTTDLVEENDSADSLLVGISTPNEDEIQLLETIKTVMDKEQIYKKPKMQLSDLAEHLDISPRKISFVLNKYEKQSFSDFINTYRTNAIIAEIEAGALRTKTIETIALENGFANKSNFYIAFKKITGKTPTSFAQKLDVV